MSVRPRLLLDYTTPLPLQYIDQYLVPGDCLLYRGRGLLPALIRLKTWSDVSHIEMYFGNGVVGASRAEGVNTYRLKTEGLRVVLRPTDAVDMAAVRRWHDQPFDPKTQTGVTGQKYDTLGLFRFFTIGKQSMDRQFCSEWQTRAYRQGGFNPFAEHYDADLVSPGMYLSALRFQPLFVVEKHEKMTAAWRVVAVAA